MEVKLGERDDVREVDGFLHGISLANVAKIDKITLIADIANYPTTNLTGVFLIAIFSCTVDFWECISNYSTHSFITKLVFCGSYNC